MKPKYQTTALQLLSIIFEGHPVIIDMEDVNPIYGAADVARAVGLENVHKAIRLHVDADQLTVRMRPVRSSNGTVQNRSVQFLTASGVFSLVMASRKPAARRFQRWLADEVIPQLAKYGSYIPGATPAERLQALERRTRQERAALIAHDTAAYPASGLSSVLDWRAAHGIAEAEAKHSAK